jgi:hypothetical protein
MSLTTTSKDAAVLIFVPAIGVMNCAAFTAAQHFIFRLKSAMAVWTSKGYRSHI